jgi:CO/xanthine dehydrogenase FAD-binding subunit
MKPAQFEYYDPTTLDEALQLLAEFGETARPLAGGQSLVPMMNMRLARPAQVVDLNRLAELSYIKIEAGELRIGAMTRQRTLEKSRLVAQGWPILHEVTRYIGHVQIRNRGTVGGSLAHAFPSAELPLAMVALDASFLIRSAQQERTVAAKDFFVDVMTTVLNPGELLIEIRVPALRPKTSGAFQEISRRYGDFALMGVAALLTFNDNRAIDRARLVFTGATPYLSETASEQLAGRMPNSDLFRNIAESAAAELETDSDIHASAEYRKEVAAVLARRVLEQAATRVT